MRMHLRDPLCQWVIQSVTKMENHDSQSLVSLNLVSLILLSLSISCLSQSLVSLCTTLHNFATPQLLNFKGIGDNGNHIHLLVPRTCSTPMSSCQLRSFRFSTFLLIFYLSINFLLFYQFSTFLPIFYFSTHFVLFYQFSTRSPGQENRLRGSWVVGNGDVNYSPRLHRPTFRTKQEHVSKTN